MHRHHRLIPVYLRAWILGVRRQDVQHDGSNSWAGDHHHGERVDHAAVVVREYRGADDHDGDRNPADRGAHRVAARQHHRRPHDGDHHHDHHDLVPVGGGVHQPALHAGGGGYGGAGRQRDPASDRLGSCFAGGAGCSAVAARGRRGEHGFAQVCCPSTARHGRFRQRQRARSAHHRLVRRNRPRFGGCHPLDGRRFWSNQPARSAQHRLVPRDRPSFGGCQQRHGRQLGTSELRVPTGEPRRGGRRPGWPATARAGAGGSAVGDHRAAGHEHGPAGAAGAGRAGYGGEPHWEPGVQPHGRAAKCGSCSGWSGGAGDCAWRYCSRAAASAACCV
mmetsp:Transcript_64731/g.173373  ORF Transcript_64731/g.173373 Transcript_64731/m.173373 type:complete len:334 (+) Transcript_64731:348-1349(+)